RFGFDNGSSIDSLLDKDEVSLEAILDEDDLLQECKSQNTRLIDYFQRVDVLQRLLGYVTGQIEGEDAGKFKYPYVATEVLCSEIWSIVETCLSNADQLLNAFWENVLDRDEDSMQMHLAMASHFSRINAVFLNKKPLEMFAFIRSQPDVIERVLRHIETPPFSDLLLRIIQLDEQPGASGVLEWLSEERLMARLVQRLAPAYSPDMHTVVAELIKNIISMAAASPGAGITEGSQIGPASNSFARELARKSNVQTLVDYMLTNFGPDSDARPVHEATTTTTDDAPSPRESAPPLDRPPPNFESCISSVLHSICIIIELIRQNNSDYFEPYLFHTLRNRLIQVQQHLVTRDPEEGRIALEGAMKEMVDRMGVVHLGPVLDILSDCLEQLQQYLEKPRSLDGPIPTTIGELTPLTFERYRICELFAELLHCSNMTLLNRPAEYNYLYDEEGRLQGGLSALEDLANVISMGTGDDGERGGDEGMDEVEPAMELPVHGTAQDSTSLLDSDEDMSDGDGPGSSDDDPMEDIAISDSPRSSHIRSPTTILDSPAYTAPALLPPENSPPKAPLSSSPSLTAPALPDSVAAGVTGIPRRRSSTTSNGSTSSTMGRRSVASKRSSRRFNMQDASLPTVLPSGERLKQKLLECKTLSVVLDLFFDFPWNNFLHSVVYDLIHQILTGRVDTGVNRALAVALFQDAKLMHRIVEGQRRNDVEIAKPKGVRLGYMGHLTLIAEDVLLALEHFPLDLRDILSACAPQPDWDEYVHGRYHETKARDTSLLGGGKPVGGRAAPSMWKVDEADLSGVGAGEGSAGGEFRRATGPRPTRESSADFGSLPGPDDEPDDEPSHPTFARYLAQEMHSPDEFGAAAGDSADESDEDDDGGWLAHSQFQLEREPPASLRERRPLSAAGFDDSFSPGSLAVAVGPNSFADPFASEEDDDDDFGPFSNSASESNDPLTFSASFSDSFGDFGEFQSTDGETTPTTGSWMLASGDSDTGDGD
ncbi:SIT4 phosphatase-associated protein-domain-containing protein, partial [Vararia minispora EC-137]